MDSIFLEVHTGRYILRLARLLTYNHADAECSRLQRLSEILCLLCRWSPSPLCQQIATQIAVLIAKVARLDCPRQWPELIPILLESVKGQDGLRQHRALLTFYHVTKTLASKRLAQDRRLFQDVSPH